MNNGTVLVTGVHGFIGRHLVNALDGMKYHIVGLDLIEEPSYGPKPRYDEFRCQDLKSLNLNYNYDLTEFDVIYHLAASTGLNSSDNWLQDSYPDFRDNVEVTYALLKNMRRDAVFVFISSAAVYGRGRMLTENSPITPNSAYGFTKAVAERIIEASGIDYMIFRPGTVFGPWGRSYLNRIIWEIVNDQEFILFNNGDNLRSIVHVDDVVRTLLDHPPWSQTYNLSHGDEISGIQLYDIISEEAKKRGYKPRHTTTAYIPPGLAEEVTLSCNWLERTVPLIRGIEKLFDHYEHEEDEPVQQFEVKM